MAKGKGGVLDRVFAKAKRGKRLRSDLAKELTRQHDEFAARLAAGEASGTPYDWESLAEGFRAEGYTAARGAELTGDRLRRIWARVAERVRLARGKAGAVAPVPVADASPAIPVSPSPIRNATPAGSRREYRENEDGGFTLPPAARPRDTGKKEDQ